MELMAFGARLAKLRHFKGVSAREMSLFLGKSANYINKIESNKSFPSMQVFFDICDYFGISQVDFFDEGNTYPERLNELVSDYKKLDENEQNHLTGLAKILADSKK